jgi:hypothetical protein
MSDAKEQEYPTTCLLCGGAKFDGAEAYVCGGCVDEYPLWKPLADEWDAGHPAPTHEDQQTAHIAILEARIGDVEGENKALWDKLDAETERRVDAEARIAELTGDDRKCNACIDRAARAEATRLRGFLDEMADKLATARADALEGATNAALMCGERDAARAERDEAVGLLRVLPDGPANCLCWLGAPGRPPCFDCRRRVFLAGLAAAPEKG